MHKKYFNEKGLTLVEVVVSAVVLSLLAAGIFASYITARNMAALAFNKMIALNWAASRIEFRKSGIIKPLTDNPAEENVLENDKGGTCTPTQTPINIAGGNVLSSYAVRIDWVE
ncbi:MAG: prepilin-type N-terminal cleavage/methylation domain-containing protein [Candidatus Omnitrophota bacterium]